VNGSGYGQYAYPVPMSPPQHEHEHEHEHDHNTQDTSTYVRPPYPREVLKRAMGVRALCICDILFSLWAMVLGGSFLLYLLFLPIDIIGFYGASRLLKVPMSIFSFGKAFILGLYLLYFADIVANWVHCGSYCSHESTLPLVTVLMVIILIVQMMSIYFAVKIRRDILLAERTPASGGVELNSVDTQAPAPQQPPSTIPNMHPVYPQEPHPMGAPAYPYPPTQYFPMPYMNQVPQGYPMPYGSPYPHPSMVASPTPTPTYPVFTIGDEQQQQQPRNPDTQPLL